VRRADVYRREPVAFAPAAIGRLLAAEGQVVLAVSSGQALQHAVDRLPTDALARLRAGRVVAASARLAALARSCGFSDVAVACGPRPAQLLSALADGGETAR
jgi:uroporphyrinogen-III synthase